MTRKGCGWMSSEAARRSVQKIGREEGDLCYARSWGGVRRDVIKQKAYFFLAGFYSCFVLCMMMICWSVVDPYLHDFRICSICLYLD